MTPGTRSGSLDADPAPDSSPPSSPPSMPDTERESDGDAEFDPKAEAMRKEEERLTKESQRRQKQSNKKAHDVGSDEKNFKELDWFMSKSKVRPMTFDVLCFSLC